MKTYNLFLRAVKVGSCALMAVSLCGLWGAMPEARAERVYRARQVGPAYDDEYEQDSGSGYRYERYENDDPYYRRTRYHDRYRSDPNYYRYGDSNYYDRDRRRRDDEYHSRRSDKKYVKSLYREYLGRQPDRDGLDAHLDELEDGASRKSIKKSVRNSREARERYVNRLYKKYLRRDADQAGLDHFVDEMDRGASHSDIKKMIKRSDEYKSKH